MGRILGAFVALLTMGGAAQAATLELAGGPLVSQFGAFCVLFNPGSSSVSVSGPQFLLLTLNPTAKVTPGTLTLNTW